MFSKGHRSPPNISPVTTLDSETAMTTNDAVGFNLKTINSGVAQEEATA